MTDLISPDQTGFIKNCHSFTSIRRLLGVIHSPASLETPEVIVSLDAEKAFDRVDWEYLFIYSAGKVYLWPKIDLIDPFIIHITKNISSHK